MSSFWILILVSWWNSSWSCRKPCSLWVSTGVTDSMYQCRVVVDYDSDMQLDFDDIRFIDETETSELKYWLESKVDGDSAIFWVKEDDSITTVPSILYMYYGNPTATSTSSADSTFVRVIDSLRASWNFDEGSGDTAYDNSGNNNKGVLKNSPTWVSGRYGTALSFDGVDDYVEIPNAPSLNPATITVEIWVWFSSIPYTSQIALNKESQYRLIAGDVDTSHLSIRYQTLVTSWFDGTLIGNTLLEANRWYHAVATYNGKLWILYLNGKLDGEKADSGNIKVDTHSLIFGDYIPGGGWHFNGLIDEVRIFSLGLSDKEVSDLYNYYGFAIPNYPGKVLVRKGYILPNYAFGAEQRRARMLRTGTIGGGILR